VLFAAAFMAYSGLVLSSWNSIAFWNTPLLPILYVAYSFLAGLGALPLVVLAVHGGEKLGAVGSILWPSLLLLLALNGFLLLIYLWGMATATVAARESVRRLVSGEHCWEFLDRRRRRRAGTSFCHDRLGDRTGVGYNPASALWLATACGAIQVGGFLLRDNFLRVGIYGYPV
jgi:formate-dependent nitrite reductase membrane component NrfD